MKQFCRNSNGTRNGFGGLEDHCCQTGPGDIAGFVLNKLHNSLGNTNIPILMPARK